MKDTYIVVDPLLISFLDRAFLEADNHLMTQLYYSILYY